MVDKFGMKKKLDKAGLALIALGAAVIVLGFLVISIISGFSIYLFGIVLPAIAFILITLKDRLVGSLTTTIISAFLLVPVIIGLSSPESSPTSYGFFAILICLLLGGACILTSLAMRAPRQENNKA